MSCCTILCPFCKFMFFIYDVRSFWINVHIYTSACLCCRLVGRISRPIPTELRHCWNLATGARGLPPRRGWLPRHIHYRPRVLGWIKNSCCLQQQKAPVKEYEPFWTMAPPNHEQIADISKETCSCVRACVWVCVADSYCAFFFTVYSHPHRQWWYK